jgi:hypothetical protein
MDWKWYNKLLINMQERPQNDEVNLLEAGAARQRVGRDSALFAGALGCGVSFIIAIVAVFFNYTAGAEVTESSLRIPFGVGLGAGALNGLTTIVTGRDFISRGFRLAGRLGVAAVEFCREGGRGVDVAEPHVEDADVAVANAAEGVVAEEMRGRDRRIIHGPILVRSRNGNDAVPGAAPAPAPGSSPASTATDLSR